MACIVLRGCCDNIVPNVHAPTEEKSDESKDSLYVKIRADVNHIPRYHMKIMLGGFNAKWDGVYWE